MEMIKAVAVSKSYGNVRVLDNVSLTVRTGETVAFIGPSGAGKSTLLRCIAGLENPDRGTIAIEGKTRREGRTSLKTGMVFQNFNLFPQMKVIDNLTLAPMLVNRLGKAEAQKKAMALLAKVGLENMAGKYPGQLSGGEKQRVAIARALAMDPDIMLFDEPTSALDPELTGEVLAAIRRLAEEGMTILIASHEMEFVRRVADRVLFMEKGAALGLEKPELFFGKNANPRIRSFLSRITNY